MNILFVCTGNTCRSPMAQALLQKEFEKRGLSEKFKVRSAGLSSLEGDTISFEAVQALSNYEIEDYAHSSQRLDEQLMADSDIILTMTRFHTKMILTLHPQHQMKVAAIHDYLNYNKARIASEHLPVDDFLEVVDPYMQSQAVYDATAAQLAEMMTALADILS